MPQLGETVVEGTITKWLKKEGETVDRDEPLFEISTDKVDTEVPSPVGGTVVQIKVPEGETVSVGTELAVIDAGGNGQAASSEGAERAAETARVEEEREDAEQAEEAAPREADQPERGPAEETEPSTERPQPEEERKPPAEPATQARSTQPAAATAERGPRSQILSPLVRRLAEENQVDLAQVQGTGTGGRITKKDVLAYAEAGGAAAKAPSEAPSQAPAEAPAGAPAETPSGRGAPAPRAGAGEREEAVPLTRMRQAIARNMVASMQTSARAWNLAEVNMEHVVRTREAAKDAFRQREGLNLTYMPFVARAVCEALLEFPDVNSELRDDSLILKHYVNLGIAVALDEGLIVPVVKGADSMNLVGLARAINDIATRARSKKLVPDDVQGGTFTITNPGPFGSIISVPIINPPQCAILAFDAIEKRPVVEDDAIAIRHMVYLSMSWDHRIIDGATAAKFLARVKQNLETWDFGPELGLTARAG
jgi:2-oxoglutarate dehydrogenase E2 component (dihydrolipoamide succinyltransferase)